IMSSGFHSYDKQGRPTYIEFTGRTDIQALVQFAKKLACLLACMEGRCLFELPLDQVIKRLWYCEKHDIKNERNIVIEKSLDVETMVCTYTRHDRGVTRIETNSDTDQQWQVRSSPEKLFLLVWKALNLFKKLAKLDQEYYPERMGKVSQYNLTTMFEARVT
ncbi:hypothetical protein QZH41_019177, partial [Actinostola sp. cb2023]